MNPDSADQLGSSLSPEPPPQLKHWALPMQVFSATPPAFKAPEYLGFLVVLSLSVLTSKEEKRYDPQKNCRVQVSVNLPL